MSLSKKELGLKIKEARNIKSSALGRKYTGQMLSDDVDISRSYLGDIESGRIYPNYTLLTSIADACGVPLSFFDNEEVTFDNRKKNIDLEKQKQIDTVAAHLEDKNLTPKKVKLLKDYIDALFDDEEW